MVVSSNATRPSRGRTRARLAAAAPVWPGGLALVLVTLAACAVETPADGGAELDAGAPEAAVSPLPDAGAVDSGEARDAGWSEDGGAGELRAVPGAPRYAILGEEVVLDGAGSIGATAYQWSFGDGRGASTPGADPIARVRYDSAGRWSAVLTVFDGTGRRHSASVLISVTAPLTFSPAGSGTVTLISRTGSSSVAVVSPDSGEVAIAGPDEAGGWSILRRISTGRGPRTVAVLRGRLVVPCQDDDTVHVLDPGDGEPRGVVVLPYGSRPYGAVASEAGDAIYVSLAGSGRLAELVPGPGGSLVLARLLPAVPDARGVARLPGGRIGVTRWRSPDTGGELVAVDPVGGGVEPWSLAVDPQRASDTEIGGVPSLLGQLAVSPTGLLAVVPSLQANLDDGAFRSGRLTTHETILRAALSFVELPAGRERFELRKQLDERGLAAAAAFTARGDYLFVAIPGSRLVERFDVLSHSGSGTIPAVGWAPSGLAVSADDRFLFADAQLSRELVIYALAGHALPGPPIARLVIPSEEPLAPEVLLGKRLFTDALDPRITRSGYVACAHCHPDGESDGRVWDLTQRGEGLRNTTSLRGRAGALHGPLHWSANFDEVQDFEHDLRVAFGGTGLMSDAAFHEGTRDRPLGDPKAGVSPELDALAAYLGSLSTWPRSPVRTSTGALSPSARRGRMIFESPRAACLTCHVGAQLTDSRFLSPAVPLLHDVGTLRASSGARLGGPLSGIDTPTLHDLHGSAPYLHDGSAATLAEVLRSRNLEDRHGVTSTLTAAELADLEQYLLSLDGRRD